MTLMSRSIDIDGRPTEVLAGGRSAPLIFLHGGGIIEGFDCLEPWTQRFSVFAPLRPGYGATEPDPPLNGRAAAAENVRDVLDALGVERTTLVGHSLGGWIAAAVAASIPDRVSALVLGAPWGMDVPEYRGADLSSMSASEIAATLTNDPTIWEGRLPSEPDPAFEAARNRELKALTSMMPGTSDPELPSILLGIQVPTLLLWGEDDKVTPSGNAHEWLKALPNGSLRTFAETGHLLFHERPDAVQAVTEFVEARRNPT
jgi:pimeloyl-ACP methyl ester carboxylesterase